MCSFSKIVKLKPLLMGFIHHVFRWHESIHSSCTSGKVLFFWNWFEVGKN